MVRRRPALRWQPGSFLRSRVRRPGADASRSSCATRSPGPAALRAVRMLAISGLCLCSLGTGVSGLLSGLWGTLNSELYCTLWPHLLNATVAWCTSFLCGVSIACVVRAECPRALVACAQLPVERGAVAVSESLTLRGCPSLLHTHFCALRPRVGGCGAGWQNQTREKRTRPPPALRSGPSPLSSGYPLALCLCALCGLCVAPL